MACFLFQTCMYWGIWFMLTDFLSSSTSTGNWQWTEVLGSHLLLGLTVSFLPWSKWTVCLDEQVIVKRKLKGKRERKPMAVCHWGSRWEMPGMAPWTEQPINSSTCVVTEGIARWVQKHWTRVLLRTSIPVLKFLNSSSSSQALSSSRITVC